MVQLSCKQTYNFLTLAKSSSPPRRLRPTWHTLLLIGNKRFIGCAGKNGDMVGFLLDFSFASKMAHSVGSMPSNPLHFAAIASQSSAIVQGNVTANVLKFVPSKNTFKTVFFCFVLFCFVLFCKKID